MPTTIVLDPVATREEIASFDSKGFQDIAGLRIAVLDNTKPNAVEIMEAIAQGLVRDYGAASYAVFRKLSAAQGASEADYHRIASDSDVVITGSGDCGGCTSWSVLDAVELERRGLTSLLLVTDAFVPLANVIVARQGIPELRLMETPHPIGGRPTSLMPEIGESLVPAAAKLLMMGGPAAAA